MYQPPSTRARARTRQGGQRLPRNYKSLLVAAFHRASLNNMTRWWSPTQCATAHPSGGDVHISSCPRWHKNHHLACKKQQQKNPVEPQAPPKNPHEHQARKNIDLASLHPIVIGENSQTNSPGTDSRTSEGEKTWASAFTRSSPSGHGSGTRKNSGIPSTVTIGALIGDPQEPMQGSASEGSASEATTPSRSLERKAGAEVH